MDEQPAVETSDVEIALLLMERDEDGLRFLYRKYGPSVKGWLKKRFREVLAEPEIDEALNVAVYKVWENAESYDEGKGTLGSWLLRIAANAAADILRQEIPQRLKALPDRPDYGLAAADPEESDPPEESAGNDQIINALRAVLEELPALQQAIIRADLAANGVADAGRLAEMHGTSLNSIYVSRNKARQTIRRKLMERGYFREDGGQTHAE